MSRHFVADAHRADRETLLLATVLSQPRHASCGLPALPYPIRTSSAQRTARPTSACCNCSPFKRRRTRRLSSGFDQRRPNRADPLKVCTSGCRAARRTPFLDWCFSFHRSWPFSDGWIRRWRARDMLFAGFRWLRNRSLVRSFRSVFPSRSHFIKGRRRWRGLFLARLGFSRSECRPRRLGEQLLRRLN
jgi:hypothetical protein